MSQTPATLPTPGHHSPSGAPMPWDGAQPHLVPTPQGLGVLQVRTHTRVCRGMVTATTRRAVGTHTPVRAPALFVHPYSGTACTRTVHTHTRTHTCTHIHVHTDMHSAHTPAHIHSCNRVCTHTLTHMC